MGRASGGAWLSWDYVYIFVAGRGRRSTSSHSPLIMEKVLGGSQGIHAGIRHKAEGGGEGLVPSPTPPLHSLHPSPSTKKKKVSKNQRRRKKELLPQPENACPQPHFPCSLQRPQAAEESPSHREGSLTQPACGLNPDGASFSRTLPFPAGMGTRPPRLATVCRMVMPVTACQMSPLSPGLERRKREEKGEIDVRKRKLSEQVIEGEGEGVSEEREKAKSGQGKDGQKVKGKKGKERKGRKKGQKGRREGEGEGRKKVQCPPPPPRPPPPPPHWISWVGSSGSGSGEGPGPALHPAEE